MVAHVVLPDCLKVAAFNGEVVRGIVGNVVQQIAYGKAAEPGIEQVGPPENNTEDEIK